MKTFKQYNSNMKTLFVQRKLLNAADLRKWALSNGFKTTVPLDEMHVTCAFSSKKVDWNTIKFNKVPLVIAEGKRTIAALGDKGAIVLKFTSQLLQEQWQKLIDKGCTWDYDSYQPHVTITYEGTGVKTAGIEPYDGELKFGPQEPSEVDKNFVKKLKET